MSLSLGPEPVDPSALIAAVASPQRGAILLFLGTTRDRFEGQAVLSLHYEAADAMVRAEFAAIAAECAERFGAAVAVHHRTGTVGVGEASVGIAVATAHRADAYAASRHAIERLKADVPIWKEEHTTDGASWKANAPGRGEP